MTSREEEMQVINYLNMGYSIRRTAKATSIGERTVRRIRDKHMPTHDRVKKNRPYIPKSVLDDWDRLHARYGRRESNVKD